MTDLTIVLVRAEGTDDQQTYNLPAREGLRWVYGEFYELGPYPQAWDKEIDRLTGVPGTVADELETTLIPAKVFVRGNESEGSDLRAYLLVNSFWLGENLPEFESGGRLGEPYLYITPLQIEWRDDGIVPPGRKEKKRKASFRQREVAWTAIGPDDPY